jgi:hypothetical protein
MRVLVFIDMSPDTASRDLPVLEIAAPQGITTINAGAFQQSLLLR